jgi:type F conjugative transfer system protein TrbI
MAQTTPEEPTLISPASETDATPYTRPEKKSHVPAGMVKLIFIGVALLVALLAVVLIFSHKMVPTKSHGQASKRTHAQQQTTATTGVMPADENNTPSAATGSDPDSITPKDILATKNSLEAQKRHAKAAEEAAAKPAGTGQVAAPLPAGSAGSAVQTSKQLNALAKTIGSIAPFQPPAYNGASTAVQPSVGPGAAGTQYQTGASYSEATRAWNDEVTKTRIVFSRKSVPAEADAIKYLGPAITNFGLEPGFHVAARLEASATTSVAAPVTAVIEYNYEREGQIVLPAGSRAIGRINSADAHGNMAITFESIDLPNGSTVPISAVAVDTNLSSLKGQVTGSSRGKAMFVATLSGIGQTTAMMLGNNTTTALSGQDMMRSQLSQNMGNTADSQISKMISNEKIVVTVAAGTELYMVFTKAALPQNSAQQSPLATNSSHIQPISESQSGR